MKYLDSGMLDTIISNRINSGGGGAAWLLSMSVLAICGARTINIENAIIFNEDKLWERPKRNK